MLEQDIEYFEKVIKLKTKNELYNNYFCWLYPFTNENITGMYSYVNFKDADVLTVTSSGDHALNAIFLGAKNIDSFDKNPLAKYYSELKIASIKTLEYDKFVKFLHNKHIFKNSKEYLSEKLYNEVQTNLKGKYLYFWNYVLNKYNGKKIHNSNLFTSDFLSINYLTSANKYMMDEQNYYKLRELLKGKKINYLDADFYDLNTLNKKYDVIVLSNLVSFLLKDNNEKNYEKVKKILDNFSKETTTTILSYLYYGYLSDNSQFGVYNRELIKKYFPEFLIEYFNSSLYIDTYSPTLCDGILINSSQIKKLTR